jgi:membrane protease YdiL (CAAX protease family)
MIPVGALQLGLLVAIAICCVALWNQIFLFRSAGQQIVNYEPRRAVPWGPLDVVALAVGTVLIVNLCTFPLRHLEQQSPETQESAEKAAGDTADERSNANEGSPNSDAGTEETKSGEVPKAHQGEDDTESVNAGPVDTKPAETASAASDEKPAAADTFGLLMSASIGTMLSLAAGMVWLRFRGATSSDMGLRAWELRPDFLRGLAGFLVASLPVYLIQIIAVQFIPAAHPVSEIFQSRPSPLTLLVTTVTAVVVAPLTEEFFFRVVLQGWLERLFAEREVEVPAEQVSAASAWPIDGIEAGVEGASQEHTHPAEPATNDTAHFRSEISTSPDPDVTLTGHPSATPAPSMVPVYLSSFIFAIMHLDYGPSALALFFFALVLGYLYRQTHRLWPSVMAHASLNAISTFMLLTTTM